jgi:hypothetical protein
VQLAAKIFFSKGLGMVRVVKLSGVCMERSQGGVCTRKKRVCTRRNGVCTYRDPFLTGLEVDRMGLPFGVVRGQKAERDMHRLRELDGREIEFVGRTDGVGYSPIITHLLLTELTAVLWRIQILVLQSGIE